MLTDMLTGLGQVAETLALVGDALGAKENQLFVCRQVEVMAGFLLVHRCKYVSINGFSKCTMPDGTVFDSADRHYGETESIRIHTFVKKIIEWAEKHARPKLRLSDETEFMDI